MSELFTYKGDDEHYFIKTKNKHLTGDEVDDLLNFLSEENEQLKFENETLKSNYQREIQSSIDFCNAYSKTNGELLEEIEKLEKENEQLREDREVANDFIVKKGLDIEYYKHWRGLQDE